ncbi:MAG: branched-chain amino acid aminotransferase [Candidatus Promineifilaceae bacterium]
MNINIVPLDESQLRTPPKDFTFGKDFANRMFIQNYHVDKGWHNARIDAFQPITLSPAASVFHYGQELFEGTKAYRREDGNINLFRVMENMNRFNASAARISMAQVDPEAHMDAIIQLVKKEQAWVPEPPSTLYIRPAMIASAPQLGLAASPQYLHFIIIGPVGNYFAGGFKPLSVWVENEYVRAVPGGTGNVKVGGNYAAAVYVSEQAKQRGYAQVLWLDGRHRKYVEEVGAMNIAFVYEGKHIVTPELSGSILPGVTRNSVLRLAPDIGYTVEEKRLDIHDILADVKSGKITEAFGMGTAAVIAPVGSFGMNEDVYSLSTGDAVGPVSQHLLKTLTDIQFGRIPDPYNWITTIEVDS